MVGSAAVTELITDFYQRAWNAWDDSIVDRILTPGFVFRGSLGDEVRGRSGWRGYRDKIRTAVPDFHNEIVDLVVASGRAAARLRYSGHHHGPLLGFVGTGRPIEYAGTAFFTVAAGQLTDAWVLGDLDALRRQLRSSAQTDGARCSSRRPGVRSGGATS